MSLPRLVTHISKLGIVYIVGTIVLLLIGIVVLPIFTRYLNPEQYGIVALVKQVMSLLGVLIQVGLLHSLTSHYFRTDEHLRPQLVRTVLLHDGSNVAALRVTQYCRHMACENPAAEFASKFNFCLFTVVDGVKLVYDSEVPIRAKLRG